MLIFCLCVPVYAISWEWAVEPEYELNPLVLESGPRFSEGLAAVKKDGLYGYIDTRGNVVIPFVFVYAAPFFEGLAAASLDGEAMGFIRYLPPDAPAQVKAVQERTPDQKVAYITIDDGPSRNNTPVILDILKEHGAKATFFVLPHNGMDAIYTRILDEGHEMANHSHSHDLRRLFDPGDLTFFINDIVKAHGFIQEKGHTATIYRFPGGSGGRPQAVLSPRLEILRIMGYRHFDWHVSTGDSDTGPAGRDPDVLTANVLNNTQNRQHLIVLLHDTADKTATVQALPRILQGLAEQGYVFDTLADYE
jgi:peptidoglycan/xylan/chitin deacetylase (PgdA/CDA1 family)